MKNKKNGGDNGRSFIVCDRFPTGCCCCCCYGPTAQSLFQLTAAFRRRPRAIYIYGLELFIPAPVPVLSSDHSISAPGHRFEGNILYYAPPCVRTANIGASLTLLTCHPYHGRPSALFPFRRRWRSHVQSYCRSFSLWFYIMYSRSYGRIRIV